MENVAFDLVEYYPPVPPKPYANGEVSYKWMNGYYEIFVFMKVTF